MMKFANQQQIKIVTIHLPVGFRRIFIYFFICITKYISLLCIIIIIISFIRHINRILWQNANWTFGWQSIYPFIFFRKSIDPHVSLCNRLVCLLYYYLNFIYGLQMQIFRWYSLAFGTPDKYALLHKNLYANVFVYFIAI